MLLEYTTIPILLFHLCLFWNYNHINVNLLVLCWNEKTTLEKYDMHCTVIHCELIETLYDSEQLCKKYRSHSHIYSSNYRNLISELFLVYQVIQDYTFTCIARN